MSFGRPPFEAVWLIPTNERGIDKTWFHWECDGCGGGWKQYFPPNTPIEQLWKEYVTHLRTSHELVPECGFKNIISVEGTNKATGELRCTREEKHSGEHLFEWTQYQ